jgi:hypothetical protein
MNTLSSDNRPTLPDTNGKLLDFPPLADGRPSSADVMASLNEIRQILHQLGENYSKLHAATFPVTDCNGLARILGKSASTIRRWTESDVIPAYKVPSGDGKVSYFYNIKRIEQTFEEEYST